MAPEAEAATMTSLEVRDRLVEALKLDLIGRGRVTLSRGAPAGPLPPLKLVSRRLSHTFGDPR